MASKRCVTPSVTTSGPASINKAVCARGAGKTLDLDTDSPLSEMNFAGIESQHSRERGDRAVNQLN